MLTMTKENVIIRERETEERRENQKKVKEIEKQLTNEEEKRKCDNQRKGDLNKRTENQKRMTEIKKQ